MSVIIISKTYASSSAFHTEECQYVKQVDESHIRRVPKDLAKDRMNRTECKVCAGVAHKNGETNDLYQKAREYEL